MNYSITGKFHSLGLVVTTYNNSNTILRALESVVNQSSSFDQIVITDDGSNDDTIKKIQFYLKNQSRKFLETLIISTHENLGTYENLKSGITNLSTDFFFGLAGDDLLPLDCCERIRNYLNIAKPKEIIVGKLMPFLELENGTLLKKKNEYISGFTGIKKLDLIFLKSNNISPSGGVIYHRESFVRTINNYKFGKILWEDWLLFYILCLHGFTFRSINDVFYFYVKKESHSGTSSNIQTLKFEEEKLLKIFNSIELDNNNSCFYRFLLRNHSHSIIIFMKKIFMTLSKLHVFIFINSVVLARRRYQIES